MKISEFKRNCVKEVKLEIQRKQDIVDEKLRLEKYISPDENSFIETHREQGKYGDTYKPIGRLLWKSCPLCRKKLSVEYRDIKKVKSIGQLYIIALYMFVNVDISMRSIGYSIMVRRI